MTQATYLLDTNILIQPYRTYYAMDLCPGFWDFLEKEFSAGQAFSIEKVYYEIIRNTDELTQWVKNSVDKRSFVDQSKDNLVITQYEKVSNWVMDSKQFSGSAKREFLLPNEADPWICAYASIYSSIVVTGEGYRPGARNKVPLPNVLQAFEVPYIDIYDFLRKEHARFISG